MKALWVEASPKEELSLSSKLAEAFLGAAPVEAVGDMDRFSVWGDDVLHFGPQVLAEIDRVRSFDRLLVSSPMWN